MGKGAIASSSDKLLARSLLYKTKSKIWKIGGIMQAALRITTKVMPGDKVEIQLPPGSVGEEVEIFVIIPEKTI